MNMMTAAIAASIIDQKRAGDMCAKYLFDKSFSPHSVYAIHCPIKPFLKVGNIGVIVDGNIGHNFPCFDF